MKAMHEVMQIQSFQSQNKGIVMAAYFLGFQTERIDSPIIFNDKCQEEEEGLNLTIKTDMKRLQQVIINLLSNALKFTQKNGKVLTFC